MSLHVNAKDVPERKVDRTGVEGEDAMFVRRGYGNECSLMHAVRAPGYHTTPHVHESEQINYVLEGEIWFFVEEGAVGSLSAHAAMICMASRSAASVPEGKRWACSPRIWDARVGCP